MRVFVTGASGFIGFAVVKELINAGHEVTGRARSEKTGAALRAMGAGVHTGLCRRCREPAQGSGGCERRYSSGVLPSALARLTVLGPFSAVVTDFLRSFVPRMKHCVFTTTPAKQTPKTLSMLIVVALFVGLVLVVWVWIAAVVIQLNFVQKQNGRIDLYETLANKGTAIILVVSLGVVTGFVAVISWILR
jgi:hypothetical protein